jgi:hypothetical protein
MGTFSTAVGEYPITTTYYYFHSNLNGPSYIPYTSAQLVLKKPDTGQVYPFRTVSITNGLSPSNFEYPYQVSINYVSPVYPPAGLYMLEEGIYAPSASLTGYRDYTVE